MSALKLDLHCRGDHGFLLEAKLELPPQGITVVYGPSGCGKSTLLDCIAGLRETSANSSVILGDAQWRSGTHKTPPWERQVGYVFQNARLFEHLSVRGNLDYAAKRQCNRSAMSLSQVSDLLQLAPLMERKPETLSAGQKQRVAIARALLRAPALLLMDEPLANLDHASQYQIMAALSRIARDSGVPVIYVSHDIEEVSQLADYLVLLDDGQVTEHGQALELSSRLDTRLSTEDQAAAILTGQIKTHESEYALTHIRVGEHVLQVAQTDQPPDSACRIRVPARDVSVCRTRPSDSSILNILPAQVTQIENTTAPRILLRLSLGDQFLLARITRKSLTELNIREGDSVFAQIKSVALLMGPTNE